MQTITLPSSMPAEMVRQTVLDTAWNLIKNNQLSTTSFVEMIALNAATNGGPTLYQTVIKLAFQDEAFELIQNLIASGLAQYPDDGWLQRAKRVMTPPKVIGTSPASSLSGSKTGSGFGSGNRPFFEGHLRPKWQKAGKTQRSTTGFPAVGMVQLGATGKQAMKALQIESETN